MKYLHWHELEGQDHVQVNKFMNPRYICYSYCQVNTLDIVLILVPCWKKGFNLGGFEHDLRRVVEEGKGALGEAMGAHEHGREPHVRPPRVHHLLHRESLQAYQGQVHKALHKREVPAVAAAYSKKKKKIKNLQVITR